MSNQIEITESQSHYHIAFPFNRLIMDRVKQIPGRWFDPVNKIWKVPKHQRSHVLLFASKFKVDMNGRQQAPEETGEIAPLPELTVEIPLKIPLFPFQRNGVAYILEKKRVIVGDQMGLGKTGQAIVAMEHAKPFPCLIICPSSLKLNWQKEISKWTNRKSIILSDNIKNSFQKYYEVGLVDYFIVNFESLKKYFVEKIEVPKGEKLKINHIHFKTNINLFKSIIIDESHRVKAGSAQQTKFTRGICKNKEWVLALTGTPVVNKPIDLISQLGILSRLEEVFGGYKKFIDRYCAGVRQASNLRELNYKLNKHCFYRRDKSEVLKDLPAKMRQVVICEINTRKEYNDAENDLATYLAQYKQATDAQIKKSMRGEIMVRIGILKNISARGKIDDVCNYIEDMMESGEKYGLFAHQHEVVDEIKKRFPYALCITGRENIHQREHAVTEFQTNPDTKLLLLGIEAAGVGLTLTAGSRCGFIELGWNPAKHDQCEDRFHRIGQKDSVQCDYFIGKNTIDEWIYNDVIEAKRGMTNVITGATDDVEVSIIDNFINLFNQPK